jgi:hypothetical protein
LLRFWALPAVEYRVRWVLVSFDHPIKLESME